VTASSVSFASPVGPMRVVSDGTALTAAEFTDELATDNGGAADDDALLEEARRQLVAYFEGRLRQFELPIAPTGTRFQLRVWEELGEIPFGATASYGQIAARLGMPPGASRAVGRANGANPIAIIVPCHRVIGSGGTLIGYAGGLHRKRYLLELESSSGQDSLVGG
jgi:methylated-DNA-[protein]-cysteine S-methyltransferase